VARRDAPDLRIEPLGRRHERAAFSCGVPALDRYIRDQAGQDARRRVAAAFVLVEDDDPRVLGYYTLSAFTVDIGSWPDDVARKLPRYPRVPATLLGRLAIAEGLPGKGAGEYLLIDALKRAWTASHEVAAVAVVVDAKDDRAVAFYKRYGFIRLLDEARKLFLPMTVVERLFS
jgi:predicted GNAT family N-acyltransferase